MNKLHKSATNRMVAGVLGGFAERYGIDATLLRVIFAFLAVVTIGFPMVILYAIAAMIMPN
ncbi:PspC domain-containing protein [Loigolactobacillus zhaoyuanensis]|uniref:PspC domain-containing protein n=1 Tax=Loigolactobacillus zhaoyuanensis TaxID=2486017 RepID=A0ABW8UCG3_9LACO|nr:PspC domain-containing protein [Loigolactobacillus zhaoyuanensis]